MVSAGSAVAPTFTFLANLIDHGDAVGAMTTQVDLFRGEIQATAEMLRTAYDAGVPILCGSESGFSITPYGHWHAREMAVLVDALGHPIRLLTRDHALYVRRVARVPFFDNETDELADAAALAATESDAIVLAFHGCSSVGATVAGASRSAVNKRRPSSMLMATAVSTS